VKVSIELDMRYLEDRAIFYGVQRMVDTIASQAEQQDETPVEMEEEVEVVVEETPVIEETPVVEETPITAEDIVAAVRDHAGRQGVASARELLNKYGAQRAGDVPVEQWPAFLAEARA
jgi:hypothetical protein